MNKTKIEWVKNPDGTQGYTFNPITGCLNGCKYCYARKLANGRLKLKYLRNFEIALPHENPKVAFNDPFYPRFWPERFKDLAGIGNKAPRGIFVCDMSDLFGIGVPEKWTRHVLEAIGNQTRHRFYLLTKQPLNLAKWSPFPDNCWVGVSIESSKYCYDKGIGEAIEQVRATVKYMSIEPMLGPVTGSIPPYVDWVIIGAQTKPTILPKQEWVEEVIEAADREGVKIFLKNNLKPLFPEGLRQEIP